MGSGSYTMVLHMLKIHKNSSNEKQVFEVQGICLNAFLQLGTKQPSHRRFCMSMMMSHYWIGIEKLESSETIIKL